MDADDHVDQVVESIEIGEEVEVHTQPPVKKRRTQLRKKEVEAICDGLLLTKPSEVLPRIVSSVHRSYIPGMLKNEGGLFKKKLGLCTRIHCTFLSSLLSHFYALPWKKAPSD